MLAGFIMASEGVRPANFYPPGELAYDAIAERLTTSRRREDANSTMIREMQSGAFIPCLFNRYDGQAVSALDARWAPEFGNRGEIESSLGATISGLDASIAALSGIPVIHPHIPAAYGIARSLTCFFQSLQTVTRHRGMGALPFNHIVFQDADLAPPTYEEWPDMIAQTPRAVIQSMRLALVSNGAMRAGVRDDQALPEGFRVVKAFEWMVGTGNDGDAPDSRVDDTLDGDEDVDMGGVPAEDDSNEVAAATGVPLVSAPSTATIQSTAQSVLPPGGSRPAEPTDMPSRAAPLSGVSPRVLDLCADDSASAPEINQADVTVTVDNEPTAIYRPDLLFPTKELVSLAPTIEYEAAPVPVILRSFVVPGMAEDVGDDETTYGRVMGKTVLPPSDKQRTFSAKMLSMFRVKQLSIIHNAFHQSAEGRRGNAPPVLREETVGACQTINDPVKDDAFVEFIGKILFRALTQSRVYPDTGEDNEVKHGVPIYTYFDSSGIISTETTFNYMEREIRFLDKAANGQRTLERTTIYDENEEPDRVVVEAIREIARRDHCIRFEFFHAGISSDGIPNFVGVRAIYGFGMNSFSSFRKFMKSADSPFTPIAADSYDANNRHMNACDRNHPSYGWLYVSMREFMGHMTDDKIIPSKGSLFTTLLPFSPASDKGNAWTEAYMKSRRKPRRETLSDDALGVTAMKEGASSNRMVACAIDLHICARFLNRIYYHGAGYYAIKDNIPIACMALAFFTDTGSIFFNSPFKYIGGPGFGTGPGARDNYDRDKMPMQKGATQVTEWMLDALQNYNDGKF
ncbi:unnamed protein product, partial [Symbiodinium necroappetens]